MKIPAETGQGEKTQGCKTFIKPRGWSNCRGFQKLRFQSEKVRKTLYRMEIHPSEKTGKARRVLGDLPPDHARREEIYLLK